MPIRDPERRRANGREKTRRWAAKNPDKIAAARAARRGSHRQAYAGHKSNAAKRGIKTTLTLAEFQALRERLTCSICAKSLQHARGRGLAFDHDTWTLDRFDSSSGYTLENVHVVCQRCNVTKGEHTPETWAGTAAAISAFFRARGLPNEPTSSEGDE